MAQQSAQKARALEQAEGVLGPDNVSLIKEFAKSMMRIYYQTTGDVSDYAKLRPLRELLKGYRLYRNVGQADQKAMMAGDVKRTLENPPKGMAVDDWVDKAQQAQIIVDQFFQLADRLFGGLPNLVNRHANSLAHAYDLALELHWREIYVERGQEFIKRRETRLQKLKSERDGLTSKSEKSKEDTERLEEIETDITRIQQEVVKKQDTIARVSQS